MMARLRALAFDILFYAGSVVLVPFACATALVGGRTMRRGVLLWFQYHRLVSRYVLGIETRITGAARPDGPALYVAKHQSFYETFELTRILGAPVVVMKRELGDIPFWGWVAKRYGAIMVDRDASSQALREMMRQAQAARAAGRPVLLFPEGTRVHPGETPALKSGFAGLYRALGLPAVPIALETAKVWPRKGMKRAGVVELRFAEPLPPGMKRDAIEAAAHAGINAIEHERLPAGEAVDGNAR